MPVSSPSEFPPHKGNGSVSGLQAGKNATGANCFYTGESAGNNSTGANLFLAGVDAGQNSTINGLIIIGNNSGGGGLTDSHLADSIIIGVNNAPVLATASPFTPATNAANVIIGSGNIPLQTDMDSTVIIGSGNFIPGVAGGPRTITSSCVIGSGNFINSGASFGNLNNVTMIGNGNFIAGSFGSSQTSALVMLGSGNGNTVNNASATTSVILGNNIQFGVQLSESVLIGELINIGINVNIGNDVVIGPGTNLINGIYGWSTLIGSGIFSAGDFNTVIGAKARVAPGVGFGGCVIIGALASDTVSGDGTFLIASAQSAGGGSGAEVLALQFGNFLTGNLVLGDSSEGVNRDMNGTNTVKLINGTVGGANPIGGGYFYVSAGALHWVGSSGTDTIVAPA